LALICRARATVGEERLPVALVRWKLERDTRERLGEEGAAVTLWNFASTDLLSFRS
jgi:hypothetical protein